MKRPPYALRVNRNTNRIYISISGQLSKQVMEKLYTDIRFGVADLQPGFVVVNDLTNCTFGSLEGIKVLNKISNFLIDNSVKTVVRVIDKDNLISTQVANLETQRQSYKVIYADTLEEAEEKLEETKKREDLRFHMINHQIELMHEDKRHMGTIIDISLSGCALLTNDLLPNIQDIFAISINFKVHENLMDVFKCKAQVVRVEGSSFAVKFLDVHHETHERLWERLVHESRCDFPRLSNHKS